MSNILMLFGSSLKQLLMLGVILVALCSCGLKQDYSSVRPELEMQGNGRRLIVAGLDNRPYVVNNDKKPSFVGLMRSGYGIPYSVHTSNDEPFAGELAKAACGSLRDSGFECESLLLSRSGIQAQLKSALENFGANSAMVFTVRDWKTDTYNGTSLRYDLSLKVTDQSGNISGLAEVEGVDDLGSSWLNPASIAQEETPKKMKEKLEVLMNKPSIQSAFRIPASR